MLRTILLTLSPALVAASLANRPAQDGESGAESAPAAVEGASEESASEAKSAFADEISPVPFAGTAEDAVKEARSLLVKGHPESARAMALTALAREPYSTDGYRVLFDVARKLGDSGSALHWGKWLWWAQHYSGDDAAAAEIAKELDGVYGDWNADFAAVEAWRESLLNAVKHAGGRGKQYRIAGHIMKKLLALDPTDEELNETYDDLFDRAGERATGGAFVAERVRSRSPKWIDKKNAEHANWSDAYERRTKYYDIITNVSYEFFETVCVVMDEMYEFYRELYDYKRKTPRVTLAICGKRSDFDRYCLEELRQGTSMGVGGWFYDKEMTVAAWDRTEGGGDLTDVYRVLFHEASHQFMYLMTEKKHGQDPPIWLNEGTASYFEGCELKADGSIVKNKPAFGRVREWEFLEGGDRKHSLEELITCPHREYDGSFYSYGWALVYFLNNYEDKNGDLLYRDAYLKYLKSYTKKGPKDHEEFQAQAFERAQRMFVEEVGDPDVPDWDAFEARWRAWTENIVQESKAGQEFADELLARSQRYLDKGDFERALIAAQQADDKRPNDARAYELLAYANAGVKRDADAVYWMVRRWEEAWARGDDAAAKASTEWLAEHGAADLVENYCNANRELVRATGELLGRSSADDMPTAGMLARAHTWQALGLRQHEVASDLFTLAEEGAGDLRLWRRAFDKGEDGDRSWADAKVVEYAVDGVLINNPSDFGDDRQPREYCDVREFRWLDTPYDLRGEVQIDGKQGALILLGIGNNGRPQRAIRLKPDKTVSFESVDISPDSEGFGAATLAYEYLGAYTHEFEGPRIPIRVRLEEGGGTIRVGENEMPLPKEFTRATLYGTIGLATGDNAVALFAELQARSSEPFWPVAPDDES